MLNCSLIPIILLNILLILLCKLLEMFRKHFSKISFKQLLLLLINLKMSFRSFFRTTAIFGDFMRHWLEISEVAHKWHRVTFLVAVWPPQKRIVAVLQFLQWKHCLITSLMLSQNRYHTWKNERTSFWEMTSFIYVYFS